MIWGIYEETFDHALNVLYFYKHAWACIIMNCPLFLRMSFLIDSNGYIYFCLRPI